MPRIGKKLIFALSILCIVQTRKHIPMKNSIFFLLLLGTMVSQAQIVEVSGFQSGTWEADTIKIVGDVLVQDSLCVAPGTTVLFDGYYQIAVKNDARFLALGTEADSVLFTVADTAGFHVFNSGSGGWNGIRMDHAGPSRFDYCRFQYGKAATDHEQDGGALRIFNSDAVEIGHSTLSCNFSREHGGALSAEGSRVVIHDCNILDNQTYSKLDSVYFMYGGGMRFLKCEVDIARSDFRRNMGQSAIGGALSLDSCDVSIDRCKFEHNYGINGAGLYLIRCNDRPCSITNSLFAHNTSGHFGGGFAISDSSPLLSNLTVVNNHSIGVNCGGIFFYQYSSPSLYNCLVYGNTNESMTVNPVQMWAWTYEETAPQFYNCLVQFGLKNIAGNDGILVYENCLEDDPLFLDDGFHIGSESPCFNSGSTETPAEVLNGLDLAGNHRVLHGCIDIGAYETDMTAIEENTRNEHRVRIVGNPISASSYAEIEMEKTGRIVAKTYSMDGKLLANKCFYINNPGTHRIEIGEMFEDLSQGMYLLVVESPTGIFGAKVLRQEF